MRSWSVLLALVLGGCGLIGNEISDQFLPDEGIDVTVTNPLVTGENGYGSLSDQCTAQDNAEECKTDVWTASALTCSGVSCTPLGSMFLVSADITPGMGSISITATSEGRTQSVGASTAVLYPDAAIPHADCSNPKPTAAPFLIPASTEITINWDLVLEGKQRLGDTGEVLVDAPGFTFASYQKRSPRARFVSPATPETYAVRSKLGDASFDYVVYSPDALTLDVISPTWPSQAPDSIEYYVTGNVGGIQTCDDPGRKTITSETPDICLLRKWFSDPPAASVETAYELYVTPQATGTCRFTITLAGSPVTRTVDVDVAPIQ